MFHIILCDNDLTDLNELKKKVNTYIENRKISSAGFEAKVTCFSDSIELMRQIDLMECNIFILDVIMPELNGIGLGEIIRKSDKNVPIIYVTSSREFAFDAYGVHASDYIEKPVSDEKLAQSLDRILDSYVKTKASIVINGKNGTTSVEINDVVYVENEYRTAVYNMVDGRRVEGICNRVSFEKSIEEVVKSGFFIQPHKSFFVNMNHIESIKSDKVIVEGGREIPVSRNRSANIKKAFLRFVTGEEKI